MEGVCKWFDLKRLYGLIQILDEDEMVLGEFLFVKSDCIGPIPWKGSKVTFVLDDPPAHVRNQNLVAIEVRRLDDFQARAPIASCYLYDEREEAPVNA